MDIEIVPFNAALGAQVNGLDLAHPLSPDDADLLREAYHRYALLVFRDQALDPAQQIAFSRYFGDLEVHVLDQWCLPDHPQVLIVSNLKDGDRHVGVYNAGRYWHTDLSYMAAPSKGSILHAIEVPTADGRVLGDTVFASTAAAYDALSPALQTRIAALKARFSLAHQRGKLRQDGDNAVLTSEQMEKTPAATHGVVVHHPVTGRKVLFVNEGHTVDIIGLPDEESKALLAELTRHVTDDRFVYRHHWRTGDVLMWDNIATQHLAIFDYALPQRRYMHRTTLKGAPLQ